MADIHEQHINVIFCFKLGKTFTETHEMMKNIYGDKCMSYTGCYGFSDLRTVGSQRMMSLVWDGPQRHVMMLMLCKFVKLYFLIIV
jgi:hypothetical protein